MSPIEVLSNLFFCQKGYLNANHNRAGRLLISSDNSTSTVSTDQIPTKSSRNSFAVVSSDVITASTAPQLSLERKLTGNERRMYLLPDSSKI